jgi:putative restriction endonuclease
MKSVFQTKQDPAYDDDPGTRYHFPKQYLKKVEATVGDSIIYYEPSRVSTGSARGGRMAYFALGRVKGIRSDTNKPDHFYADITDYLPFNKAVPFRAGSNFFESAMKSGNGVVSQGASRSSVRHIREDEFDAILEAGFDGLFDEPKQPLREHGEGFSELPMEIIRPRIEVVLTRPFRDRVFARQIQTAYNNRCAITGLRIINGGGRAEVQAAHIRPVGENGPDLVQNGLALSGTVHWMFDRGLIALDDDLRILKAHKHLPSDAERLFNADGYMIPPNGENLKPHAQFLRWHRENRFKG